MDLTMNKPMIWLFDLDNTLHDASHLIFPKITLNMNEFIGKLLGDGEAPAEPEVVNSVRLTYWKRYGATLLGMIKHHGVSQEDFLRETHRFDDLTSMIRVERGLGRFLARLTGRKILLTNAPEKYSKDVMRHLGLHRHFAKHIAIESMRVHGQLRPKPSKLMLRKLLAKEKIAPARCVLVEDTAVTLKAAKAVGMKTVLVTQYLGTHRKPNFDAANMRQPAYRNRPAYVDVKVQSVRQLSPRLNRLR